MRLISYLNEQGLRRLGAHLGDEVADLTAVGLPDTLDEVLRTGALDAAREAAQSAPRAPLATVRYLPPVTRPAKAFAIGLNYLDHAAESNFSPPKHPVIFHRFPSSWVAHEAPIVRPLASMNFDFEAELVAVIGKPGRAISRERALEHVAGYSLFNDGSIRDHQFRSTQWMMGKNFDATGGFGPAFVSADELPPGAASLQLTGRLNGQVVQQANTRDMIFDVATLVAACSEAMALQPGDLIITGTPAGVGFARKPPLWMKAGDVFEVELEGVGVLRNPVIDELPTPG